MEMFPFDLFVSQSIVEKHLLKRIFERSNSTALVDCVSFTCFISMLSPIVM